MQVESTYSKYGKGIREIGITFSRTFWQKIMGKPARVDRFTYWRDAWFIKGTRRAANMDQVNFILQHLK